MSENLYTQTGVFFSVKFTKFLSLKPTKKNALKNSTRQTTGSEVCFSCAWRHLVMASKYENHRLIFFYWSSFIYNKPDMSLTKTFFYLANVFSSFCKGGFSDF